MLWHSCRVRSFAINRSKRLAHIGHLCFLSGSYGVMMASRSCTIPTTAVSITSANFTPLNGSTTASEPCKCCPYGFHIDTDFVRYCESLLTTLYDGKRARFPSTNCRSFWSLRRKLNLALASPDLFSASPSRNSFLAYCDDFNNSKQNGNQTRPPKICLVDQSYQHEDPRDENIANNIDTAATFSTNYSASENSYVSKRSPREEFFNLSIPAETCSFSEQVACSSEEEYAESMLSDAVNKFEELALNSESSSKSTQETLNSMNDEHSTHVDSSPPSPAPSSCHSTISKSVLTQIRNHLSLSITRVKELEDQVAQIPDLNAQIKQLTSQRDALLQELNIAKNCSADCSITSNLPLDDVPATATLIQNNDSLPQSQDGHELISTPVDTAAKKISTCSIGIMTSFAPSLPRRNALVQTDIQAKEIFTRNKSVNVGTFTDGLIYQTSASCQASPEIRQQSTETADLPEVILSNSIIEERGCGDEFSVITCRSLDVQASLDSNFYEKSFVDKCVSTSDLNAPSKVAFRPTSLDLMIDSSSQSLFMPKSATSSLHCSSPSAGGSSQSIRLCDKCNQLINSTNESPCPPEISSAFAFPKIIKSDSGISVERRQIDNKIIEESENEILVYPVSDMEMTSSVNTQSSDDQDNTTDKRKVKPKKGPIDYTSVQPSPETKATLKVINENLLEPKKSNSFLLSKSVSSIKKIWFKISSSDDSDSRIVDLYLDCFEKFSTKLLDFIVNLSDINGNTAMHYAISYYNFDIVSVLLDSKVCDVNKYNKAGYTTSMLVSLIKIDDPIHREVVDRLFHQSDVNMKAKQNGQTALMLAASHGHLEICKMLLDCGAEVNLQDNDGSTALMCAAEHGQPSIAALLLAQPDCDPLLEDHEGSTALKIALINGHNEVGILLYTGTRITNYFASPVSYSSLSRLPNPPIYASHLRRTGSFSYNAGNPMRNSSVLSLRTSPPRNRHYSISTPCSPNSRS